ncbi:MAG: amino acid ABC transporter ATP-binding protein [Clostridia bacterium]|nr:amino acid ABC transporter ATP-binding protein [Clostridia bacterium]
MAYLEIKNFCKKFGNTEVLKGIDISIEKGEVLSIIGSSGSGKTTFLRCINFLETPDSGTMILDGETLFDAERDKKVKESALRTKRLNFGLVFQSFNLFPQYSVFDNITLAPLLQLKERAKKDKTIDYSEEKQKILDDAEKLLAKTGLTDKKAAYPCELSGGQQQRVAIARALALKPKILCFDEPTSALDPELTGEVLKVIRSLKGEDRTMIIVTHEMGFAKNVSDKVVFMANGVIEEEGDPKEVFDNPKSEKLKAFLTGINNKEGE